MDIARTAYVKERTMSTRIQVSLLAAIIAACAGGVAIANGVCPGVCPDGPNVQMSCISIDELADYSIPAMSSKASALYQVDINGDGYACAVFTCTLCPVTAPFCHQQCIVRGPFADNIILPD